MEMLEYLRSQKHRMNAEQQALVERVSSLPAGASMQKLEEELYLWLHMESGSVADRFWRSSAQKRGRAPRRR